LLFLIKRERESLDVLTDLLFSNGNEMYRQTHIIIVCIRCRGNVLTEPLSSNNEGKQIQTQTEGRKLGSTTLMSTYGITVAEIHEDSCSQSQVNTGKDDP
jgi:hypothetical protein